MVMAAVLLGVLVMLSALAGCGSGEPWRGEPGSYPSSGVVPQPVTGEPAVRQDRCEYADGAIHVAAVVTNNESGPRLLQGVPLQVTADGTDVLDAVGSDDELWNSATISPGRQALLREEFAWDSPPSQVSCTFGEPSLSQADGAVGTPVAAADLTLTGCGPSDELTVHNPSDEPIGVTVMVEYFDAAGHSAGRLKLGQRPTEVTRNGRPAESVDALAPGVTGHYPVDVGSQVEQWETPVDGPIAGCQVVSAAYQVNPEPGVVIIG